MIYFNESPKLVVAAVNSIRRESPSTRPPGDERAGTRRTAKKWKSFTTSHQPGPPGPWPAGDNAVPGPRRGGGVRW